MMREKSCFIVFTYSFSLVRIYYNQIVRRRDCIAPYGLYRDVLNLCIGLPIAFQMGRAWFLKYKAPGLIIVQ